jgi:chaperonin cofactor prefoldin
MSRFCEKCPAVTHLMVLDGVSMVEVMELRRLVAELTQDKEKLETQVKARERLIAEKNNELNRMRAARSSK